MYNCTCICTFQMVFFCYYIFVVVTIYILFYFLYFICIIIIFMKNVCVCSVHLLLYCFYLMQQVRILHDVMFLCLVYFVVVRHLHFPHVHVVLRGCSLVQVMATHWNVLGKDRTQEAGTSSAVRGKPCLCSLPLVMMNGRKTFTC